MNKPKVLPVFNSQECEEIQYRLASKVIQMMGRKFEEGDWTSIYCKVKNIQNRGWSNLQLDIMSECLGVEQKMLCYRSNTDIKDACGKTLMHPSATRSIRIPENESDPNKVMISVLNQYSDLIEQRTQKVIELSNNKIQPDMRCGWLLWQESLRQFLYFEEEMIKPNPLNYYSEWVESGGGTRKTSKNLWIYEKDTNIKRYSITTAAGAKIQPYFDVPLHNDPNLYVFTVIGEYIKMGKIKIWLSENTKIKLEKYIGIDFSSEKLNNFIKEYANTYVYENEAEYYEDKIFSYEIESEIYTDLISNFEGINDDHCIQLLINAISQNE